MAAAIEVEVGGRRLKLSNLEKVLYPGPGTTKAEVIDYYTRVAPALLPHMKGRPLTLKRYPNGVEGKFFYEKNAPSHRPAWVTTAAIYSRSNQANIDFCLVQDLPTLVWAANLASIELHTSLARAADIMRPTMVVFDLDPGPPATIFECCRVAMRLRDLFAELGLRCFPKTSGSKGLQVYVPLNTRITYEQTKPFALAIAQHLEEWDPGAVLSNMKKELRTGKVFVDWSQNDDHKTTVSVYSMRARERPTVSTPVTWEEVEAHGDGKLQHLSFTFDEVLHRLDRHGDLFEPVLNLKQRLPAM
ncbi:MAG: non-homologous end-joining DNA ligase [Candidatus Dormibacteria bacterium]